MTLSELAIKRPVTTFMILVTMVVLGLVATNRLPLAFLPDVQEPELFVNVEYPNASPEQVERMIIRPLEETLGSVKGLTNMWAWCNPDGGGLRLEFDWGTDMALARVEVKEKVDRARAELPDDVEEVRIGGDWDSRQGESPILEGRLSSPRDLSESYDLLERRIVRPLERVPGVARVTLDGVNPREVRIDFRLADLEAHRVDLRHVTRVLANANFDQSLGEFTDAGTRYTLRTVGTFSDVEEIAGLVLREDGLRVRDVADVTYQEPPLDYGRHLDGDFAVGITVSQESSANSVEVCEALEARIAEMNEDPELEGVNFLVWFSQGKEIKRTLTDLAFTGVFGAILACIVLYVFLRRVSTTIISVLCIPFSLIVACGIIWMQGRSLNTLTLLGLIVGVGMLVDNAVVVMENIFRHQELGLDRKRAAWLGAREVSTAVTAATLTSVIVFLPIIFNKPSEVNIYLKELGTTVCLTLLASLFVSQTLIPLATAHVVKARQVPRGRLLRALESRYQSLLALNLRRRWLTPAIGLGVTASAIFPFMRIDKNFDTNESELFVQIHYNISEEVSLEKKEEIVSVVEAALDPHREEIKARSIYSFWSDRWCMTRVYLPEGEATQENIAEVRRRLPEFLPKIPGVKIEVAENHQFWRADRGKRVGFQLVGEDSEVLGRLAEEAKERLEGIEGLTEVWTSNEQGNQELHVELDRDLAARYGISTLQPAEVVGLSFRGRRLQRFRTPQGEREMRLTLDEREQESISQLANLPLWTEEGGKVPLASMAEFRVVPGPEHIQRDNRRTNVWVSARFEEGTREDYMKKVGAAMSDMQMPYGYEWTFGSWEQRQKERSQEFLVNLLLALGLVFAVMAGLFESVRQAIGLFIALPFAISGAAWTLYATGTDFDQPAAVGLLLLIGIVVNNGIVMIEHINMYRRRGVERTEAMLRGGKERLRPILMTALTTLIGLVPMVVQKPSLGGVYYYSMALVIMGGLFVSTFLTSILLPTNVTIVEDVFRFLRVLPRKLWRLARRARREPAAA